MKDKYLPRILLSGVLIALSGCRVGGNSVSSGTSSAPLTASDASLLYVQKTGDTMTGTLSVPMVGIGTSSPSMPLDIYAPSGGTSLLIHGIGGGDTNQAAQFEMINLNAASGVQNKYVRVDNSGNLAILNSAYTTSLLTLTDLGDVIMNGGGRVGIGISPSYKFHVFDSPSDPGSGVVQSGYFNQSITPASGGTTTFHGEAFSSQLAATGADTEQIYALTGSATTGTSNSNVNFLMGTSGQTWNGGTGTVTGAFGAYNFSQNTSTGAMTTARGTYSGVVNGTTPGGSVIGTITNAHGVESYIQNTSGGSIGTAAGFYAGAPNNSGTGSISTYYGLYIQNPTAATTNYSIYSAGGTNYFGGSVGIGTTNPTLGPLQMGSGAYVTAGGVWTNASDRRLKDHIVDSKYGLNEILKLRPVDYVMKKDGEKQTGLIAQEVRKVIPELVSGKEGDLKKGETLGLSYGNLAAVLVNGMKQLHDKVQGIYAKLTHQDAEIARLKAENAELRAMLQSRAPASSVSPEEFKQIKAWACSQSPRPAFCP